MTDLAVSPSKGFSLTPQSLDEAMRFADILAKSSIVPKDFNGNPGNILVAIQWGLELGLQPMQAMQNIAVINGRPALWGDAVIALVRGSPLCEYIYETDDGHTATCRVKRRGEDEQVRTYSMDDAKLAGLQGKSGPWTQHPKRMRQMRARAFALRDVFPDVLRGMPVAEEVQDMVSERDIGAAHRPDPQQQALPTSLPAYPDEKLAEMLPTWQTAIAEDKTTPERIIKMVQSKHVLTDEQRQKIMELQPALEGQSE
ncbi:recombinase RecT [Stutzerimonas nitrititolerans]|uniref:RecT family protein n=1 Tax=Stutzerimonas nitrititolerans TaxID=2482751 RepID=A0ABX9UVB7_9GAMM|nr:recombinase RecT [Stutzerimonas nitrititolerans]RMH97302.1 hypothetical protein EA795_19165 [Stutzerimonas nitrititolerans]